MKTEMKHFQDEVRVALTKYALIPLFIISFIGICLAFWYWNNDVLERNEQARILAVSTLDNIVNTYQDEAKFIVQTTLKRGNLPCNKGERTAFYTHLYQYVNLEEQGSSFYLVNTDKKLVLSNREYLPDYLQNAFSGSVWERMNQHPNTTLLDFTDNHHFLENDLLVGSSIYRQQKLIER